MGQHSSKTYKSSQEAPRLITIRRRNTAPYAPLPPAYGQSEAEGITMPTCSERTYVASYHSDLTPNIPSSFASDEARTGERTSREERAKPPVHQRSDLFPDDAAQEYLRVEIDVCRHVRLEETIIKSIKPEQAFWRKLLEYFFGCRT